MGLASIWGRAMYPELARVVDTPTRRKCRAPRPTHGRGARSGIAAVGVVPGAGRSHESEDGQSDAASDDGELLECPFLTAEPVHAVPKAAEPLLLPYPAREEAPGAMAVAAAM